MTLPSKNSDIDIDIGLTLDNLSENITATQIKNFFYNTLKNKHHKTRIGYSKIELKNCAITLTFEDLHIDIFIYKMENNKQYVAWKNKWIHKEKGKQYDFLKSIILYNDVAKSMIHILKLFYKNENISKYSKLPSIVITEIVVQNYYNKFKQFIQKSNQKNKSQRNFKKRKLKMILNLNILTLNLNC